MLPHLEDIAKLDRMIYCHYAHHATDHVLQNYLHSLMDTLQQIERYARASSVAAGESLPLPNAIGDRN